MLLLFLIPTRLQVAEILSNFKSVSTTHACSYNPPPTRVPTTHQPRVYLTPTRAPNTHACTYICPNDLLVIWKLLNQVHVTASALNRGNCDECGTLDDRNNGVMVKQNAFRVKFWDL